MEGIIEGANNSQKKLIVTGANQMYLTPAEILERKKFKLFFFKDIKSFLTRVVSQKVV